MSTIKEESKVSERLTIADIVLGSIYPVFMGSVIVYTIYYLVSNKFSLDSLWEVGSSTVLGYFGMMAILVIVGPIIRPIIRGIINFFKLFNR